MTDYQQIYYLKGKRIVLLGLATNFSLTILKFVAATYGNSRVMMADAIHSSSDFLTDIIVLLGLKFSSRPSDRCHQFGHGKYETLSTLILSAILLVVAYETGKSAIVSIVEGQFSRPGTIALIAAAISIIVKETLFQITIRTGKKIGSSILIANAWHNRSDALSSIAALIGIGGTMIGIQMLDSIAAIAVALLILKLAIQFGWKSLSELLETSVEAEIQDRIINLSLQCEGVKDVHKLRTRKAGNRIFADIHVLVNPDLSVMKGHDIASTVRKKILFVMENTDVIVHIEPYSKGK